MTILRRSPLLTLLAALPLAIALWYLSPIAARAAEPCYARVASAPGTVYGPGFTAVQQAVDAAEVLIPPGDTVQVAGACRGVQARDAEDLWHFVHTYTQTVIITKSLTLQGGYDSANWTQAPDPVAHPTTLDADRGGRVIAAPQAVTLTLADLNVVNGWLDPSLSGDEYRGGGIYAPGSTVTLSHTNVLSNTAYQSGGAEGSDLTVLGGLVQNNYAGYTGGGLMGGPLTVTGTTFISNTAVSVGGACLTSGNSRIVNALFVDNAGEGAAVASVYSGSAVVLFSTIVGSPSITTSMSAILVWGSGAMVYNSIVTHYPVGMATAGGYVLEGNNLFFNTGSDLGAVYHMGNSWSGDPLFVNPTGVGAPNYRLASGLSPAVDVGMDLGIGTDIDGNHRPQGGGYDLGAYESPHVAQGDCHARLPDTGQVFTSTTAAAVQSAMALAPADGLVQVAGYCRGVQRTGFTVDFTRTLTLEGGYDPTDWTGVSDPVAHPTTLDAEQGGRVVNAYAGVPIALANLNVINGLTDQLGAGISAGGGATLTHVNVMSNTVSEFGGGLFAQSDPTTIVGGRFQNNRSEVGRGGAIDTSSTVNISGTQFLHNYAGTNGGAIWSAGGRIVNTLFAGNQAGGDGGALSLPGYYAEDTTVLHSTIVGGGINTPAGGTGAALAVPAYTLHVTNTIISGYTLGINNGGGTVTEDYNLFYNNTPTAGTIASGGHRFTGDPLFVDPAADDYRLASGLSPAVDVGLDEGVYTDLAGLVRPIGGGPTPFDLGAYESPYALAQNLALLKTATAAGSTITYTLRVTNTGLGGLQPLHATITDTLPAQATPNAPLHWTGVLIPPITPGGVWITDVVVTVQAGYSGQVVNLLQVSTLEGPSGAYTHTATVTATTCPALSVIHVNRFDDVYRSATMCSQCEGVADDCSLREAIERANMSAPQAVTIYLEAGIHVLSLPEPTDGGNSGGDLNVTGNVTIVGE